MNMQHKPDEFEGAVPADISPFADFEIRPYAHFKQDKAIAGNRIKLRQLDMASKRITADYPDMAAWLCLRVTLRREFSVEKAMEEENVEALVPVRVGQRICKRHRVLEAPTLPVLPGYLLVRCVPSPAAVQGLLHFEGVRDVVGGGDHPYRVPLKFVSKFIDMAAAGAYDHREPEPNRYLVGQAIRVTDGPFAGFPGTVESIDGVGYRIGVLIAIFGRETRVELDIAQIREL